MREKQPVQAIRQGVRVTDRIPEMLIKCNRQIGSFQT